MRLSEKGLGNVFYHQSLDLDIDSYEFKPEDFTDSVVLTVEEAKQLQEDFLDIVCEIVRLVGRYGVKYEKPGSLIILEGRIEQAGKVYEA